jgi:HEAT repeat protein
MKPFNAYSLALVCGLVGMLFVAGCSRQAEQFDRNVDVSAMIQQLQSSEEQQRVDACVALSEAGPYAEPAVPALIEALKDPSPLVKRLAAYALGQIGPKAAPAIPELKALLGSGERDVLTSAINAIRSIDPSALPDAHIPNVTTDVQ